MRFHRKHIHLHRCLCNYCLSQQVQKNELFQ
nr:MAG TPA: PGC7/Stella/Dppa3 domain protein [Caudoviricetes sp.]